VDGEQVKLSREEKDELDILVGTFRKEFVKALVYDQTTPYGGKRYSELDDKEKAEALQEVYKYAREAGYEKFRQNHLEYSNQPETEESIKKQYEREERKEKKSTFKEQFPIN
jgi:hypothetical protein